MKVSHRMRKDIAYYHLPGLFEFYELYRVFLPLFREHREYFYDWCEIASIYGAPADCLWGGGRAGFGDCAPQAVLELMREYEVSARLTFSNSLLKKEHLSDKKCNMLCAMFENSGEVKNGVIVHSDLLAEYLQANYPKLYLVSSTTKVLTEFGQLQDEINRDEFRYVVPDFRLNKAWSKKIKLNFFVMNVVGLDVRTENIVMKQSAVGIWEKNKEIFIVLHRILSMDICSRKP